MPAPDGRLSVFRIKGLTENKIWKIGNNVAKRISKNLYGKGDVNVSDVRSLDLQIAPTPSPPRHADIIGWPEEKSEQKSIAQQLASQATLVLNS